MKILPVSKGLVTFDIRWATDTAGPSPDSNMRTEIFLLGCKKAKEGNPCKGCFNSPTWDIGKAEHSRDPEEIADFIIENAPNKYITIGGGEPTDQIQHLIPLAKKLKKNGFHIMMYTWKSISKLISEPFGEELISHLDIVVDGEFKANERLYQEDLGDGMLSSIGSGNQIIWDLKRYNEDIKEKNKDLIGFKMEALQGLYIKPDTNDLVYITKK